MQPSSFAMSNQHLYFEDFIEFNKIVVNIGNIFVHNWLADKDLKRKQQTTKMHVNVG